MDYNCLAKLFSILLVIYRSHLIISIIIERKGYEVFAPQSQSMARCQNQHQP